LANPKFLVSGISLKFKNTAGCQWLLPVILATWEAEIRKIEV
jgi:hypothetical protein